MYVIYSVCSEAGTRYNILLALYVLRFFLPGLFKHFSITITIRLLGFIAFFFHFRNHKYPGCQTGLQVIF